MKTPRELGLPFDAWRPGQRLAIRTILGARKPHIVINAPTGSGKSTIAGALPRMDQRRHLLLTATKALQDQYSKALKFLYDVRGMSNYECLAAHDQFKRYFPFARNRQVMCDDGPCHSGENCELKNDGCLYFDRYRGALASASPLTNYAYLTAMRRYGKGLGVAQRVVCDEAHDLANQLMAACRLQVPRHLLDRRRLPRSARTWAAWAQSAIERLAPGSDADQRRRREKLTQTLQTLTTIDETWAWDEEEEAIVFEPVVPRLLMPLLVTLDAYTSVVYLSATITMSTMRTLGIANEDVIFHEMPSYFDIARRPIYLVPSARVDWRNFQNPANEARWIAAMDRWMGPRLKLKRNGIIHSVSYARMLRIRELSQFGDRMVTPRSNQLAEAVEWFKTTKDRGVILVSPAIMTGYDFPDEIARWQVIAKMPFPDTRSRIMTARIEATEGYRDELTMQTVMQACGRIVRSEDDWGETAIIDDHARWFLKENKHLAATWFTDSIIDSRREFAPIDFAA